MNNYQGEFITDTEEWKQVFSKNPNELLNDENIFKLNTKIEITNDNKNVDKVNSFSMSFGFLNGSLDTIKSDLEEYDNYMNNYQIQIANDNMLNKDEKYIDTINIKTKEIQEQISSCNDNSPIIRMY